jgi:hypothetical protein
VNVANDVAFCRACNVGHVLSDLIHNNVIAADVDVTRPPPGAWYRSSGLGGNIGATHRSLGSAIGLLLISLFWNGIVSVFVFLALNSTLHLLHLPRPARFPLPKMNGGEMGWGITIFLWLFLTPFILIGLAMLFGFLMSLGGRTEITIQNGRGTIFSGIGPLGRRRRFQVDAVRQVRIEDKRWGDSDGDARRSKQIIVEMLTGKPLKFGSMLRDDRRDFVAAALRKTLAQG